MSDQSLALAPNFLRRRASLMVDLLINPTFRAVILLGIVVGVGGLLEPSTLVPGNMGIIVTQSVPIAAIALGTMLVLIVGSIDLSVGAVASLSAVVLAHALDSSGALGGPVMLALGVGLAIGGVNAFLVAFLKLPSFVVTLGTLTAAGGITIMLSGDISLGSHILTDVAQTPILGVRADIILVIVLALLAHVMLTRSGFGVAMRGVGSDEHSSEMLGLSIRRARAAAFLMSGLFAAVTAVLLVARTPVVTPQLGRSLLLDAFAAAVIGGTSIFGGRGSATGAVLGAVLIAFIGNFLVNVGVAPSSVDLYRGAIILLALVADAMVSRVERTRALRA